MSYITLWEPEFSGEPLPATVKDPTDILPYATQLNKKDIRQIEAAFESESYEMASTYILHKSLASLKKQLASLGMDFIGEMLNREDIDEFSSPESIPNYDAITLAHDLGILTSTESMRLKQTLETVTHFTGLDGQDCEDGCMTLQEALLCLRNCTESILRYPISHELNSFAHFRSQLGSQSFMLGKDDLDKFEAAPYFYIKTIITLLLNMLKKSIGVELEHAASNFITITQEIWDLLHRNERWQIGHSYAQLFSEGKSDSAITIKKVLTKVGGFDYVPETFRSSAYTQAANEVIEAHYEINNFYKEPTKISKLYSLGSKIPRSAFSTCMTAALVVYLGNSFGISWDAQNYTKKILKRINDRQWSYFLNHCLISDRILLEKLAWKDKPTNRWLELVEQYDLGEIEITNRRIQQLLNHSQKQNCAKVHAISKELLSKITG